LGLLGLFALMRRRKNKGSEEVEDFSDLIDSGLNEQDIDVDMDMDDEVPQPVFDETEYVAHDEDASSQEAATEETSDELEDLIQEADVYIVYGLHDQAESEIKRALNTYPNSSALHAKLLENYKAAGDAESFEDATKAFMELDVDNKQDHWEEICEWGKALLPDSKLYEDSALPGVAATGAAMVAGTAIAAAADGDEAEALFGDMGEDAVDALTPVTDAEDLIEDTILDEFDEVDVTTDIGDFDDFDELDLGDEASLDSVLDASEAQAEDAIESVEIDELPEDFKIDLDDDFSVDGLEVAASEESELDAELSFDANALEGIANEDGDVSVNDAANLNLEIGAEDFDKIMPENHAYKAPTEDVSEQLDNAEEENLSFLDLDEDTEVIGETQIETKIDLARAYIDMGDIEGAKSTLAEVMEAGNDEQKRQAEELLHQNG